MKNRDKYNWYRVYNKRIAIGFASYNRWTTNGMPVWAWIHSFYYYPADGALQITLLGMNLAVRIRIKTTP